MLINFIRINNYYTTLNVKNDSQHLNNYPKYIMAKIYNLMLYYQIPTAIIVLLDHLFRIIDLW